MKKLFSILAFIIGTSISLQASPTIRIEGIKNLGMGGAGSVFLSDYGALCNPALITQQERFHFKLSDLPISISNDIIKFVDFINHNRDDLTGFDGLTIGRQGELMGKIAEEVSKYRMRVTFAPSVPGFIAGPFILPRPFDELHVGAGIYTMGDLGIKMNPGIFVPTIDLWAKVDGILSMPIAARIKRLPFNLPGELSTGLGFKYIMRSKYDKKRISIMDFEGFSIKLSELEPGRGFGFDLGFVYDMNEELAFSMVINDLFSTHLAYSDLPSEVIKGSLTLGAGYKPLSSLKLAADIRGLEFADLISATFFTKLHLGAEYSPHKVIALRAGLYQGYPTFGFGLLKFLNYAYYTRELGHYPGQIPETMHMLSLSLGF